MQICYVDQNFLEYKSVQRDTQQGRPFLLPSLSTLTSNNKLQTTVHTIAV